MGAWLLTSIGVAKYECGELVESIALYTQAKQIRELTGTLATPIGAELLEMIEAAEQGLVESLASTAHSVKNLKSPRLSAVTEGLLCTLSLSGVPCGLESLCTQKETPR